jgi:hypothetical protein
VVQGSKGDGSDVLCHFAYRAAITEEL